MRILMINYEFPPLGGGGGVACYHIARELAKLHQVDYLTTSFKGLPRFEVVDGIRVYRVPVMGRRKLSTASLLSLLTFVPSSIIKGIKLCRGNNYDVINAHFVIPSGLSGIILSKLFGITAITTVLGGDVYDPSKRFSPHRYFLTKFLIKQLLESSSVVVADSANIRDVTKSYYNVECHIDIIPLGFIKMHFNRVSREHLNLSDSDVILISVGRLVRRKAYDKAILAISRLSSYNIKYLIIGDGPENANLHKLVNDLNLEDRVKFLGHLSEEEKYQYLAVSDIYILSSIHEGFGICLMEAMYCGLPIVATNNGGQTDFLIEGQNAYLVSADDDDSLLEKISDLIEHKAKRLEMSANNMRDINKYDISIIAKRYEDLFRKYLSRRAEDGKIFI